MMLNNDKGFSLVEVMVAIGLMSVVALGLMKMSQQQSSNVATATTGYEIASILNEMRGILSNPDNCKASFMDKNAASAKGMTFLKKGDDEKFVVGQRYGQGKVKINSYSLSGADPSLGGDETYLIINFYRGKAAAISTVVKKIKLIVEPDNTSGITGCKAVGAEGSSIWQRGSGDNSSDIYFSAGKVGIGKADPEMALDVEGDVNVRGRVVLKKSIQIGDGSDCDGSMEGAMAYNSTSKIMEFCDGESWKPVGGREEEVCYDKHFVDQKYGSSQIYRANCIVGYEYIKSGYIHCIAYTFNAAQPPIKCRADLPPMITHCFDPVNLINYGNIKCSGVIKCCLVKEGE